MMGDPYNGPAFPGDGQGMSLRDYFAAKAMQGLMVNDMECDYPHLAKLAYAMADAMLKVRERS